VRKRGTSEERRGAGVGKTNIYIYIYIYGMLRYILPTISPPSLHSKAIKKKKKKLNGEMKERLLEECTQAF
jgi:hypothetical protein